MESPTANPTTDPRRTGYALCHNNLAVLLKAQGRVAEAAESYRRALVIFAATLDPQRPKVITCRANYERLRGQAL